MQWLESFRQQIGEILRTLPPPVRIPLAVALLLLVLGGLTVGWWPGGQTEVYLLDGRVFSQQEIGAMQAAFARAGLNDWQVEQGKIRLPMVRRAAYLEALVENDAMPESFGSASEQLLSSQNWFESSRTRQLRQQHAVQKELSLIVSKMAGIAEATVRYDEIETGGFPVQKQKTAVVAARGSQDQALTDDQIASIRDLVAGAIAGLQVQQVTVTDLGTGRTFRGDLRLPLDDQDRQYAARREKLEHACRDRIAQHLATYPGAVISVRVELATDGYPQHDSETRDTLASEHGLAQEQGLASERGLAHEHGLDHEQGLADGRGLAAAAAEDRAAQVAWKPDASRTPLALPRLAKNPSHSAAGRAELPLPRLVTASIALPRSYFARVWQHRQQVTAGETATPAPSLAGSSTAAGAPIATAPTEEELRRLEADIHAAIERQVRPLLPNVEDDPERSRVVVSTYDDFPAGTLERSPGLAELPAWLRGSVPWQVSDWVPWQASGGQLLAVAAAGAALLVLALAIVRRQRVRRQRVRRFAAAVAAEPAATEGRGQREGSDGASPVNGPQLARDLLLTGDLLRDTQTHTSLRDELTTLVNQDPDAAAAVLRDWIGEAA